MIVFKQVSKHYQNNGTRFAAVNSLDLEIKDQEIFGILGESGAGKSTILRLINQLEQQDSGIISIDGIDIAQLKKKELQILRQDIAFVFQNYNLLKNRTVYHNVNIALKLKGIDDEQAVIDALNYVGLADKKNQYPAHLSGGEKQRVAIARAIVTQPKILLCDEPSSALDQKTTSEMLALLKKINGDFGTSIVLVTHELGVAKEICDRVAIMEHGELKELVHVNNVKMQDIGISYSDYAKEVLTS